MIKFFLGITIFALSAYSWDVELSLPDCNSSKVAKILELNRNPLMIKKEYVDKKNGKSNAEYIEKILNKNIKCEYLISYDNTNANLAIYSQICPELKNKIEFMQNSSSSISAHTVTYEKIDGDKFKVVKKINSDLGFIWQKGECSDDSVKYFNTLKEKSTIRKLLKNKFLLVSEDGKSQTYYANPGYVVKLEKNEKLCKKNKNCELNIILKKRLNSAILDADGKLHTDESL